jgi:hypothetical protein
MAMPDRLSDWRSRLKENLWYHIRRRRPGMSTAEVQAETEQRFQSLMQMQVPSDATLKAMQRRGELGARATYGS